MSEKKIGVKGERKVFLLCALAFVLPVLIGRAPAVVEPHTGSGCEEKPQDFFRKTTCETDHVTVGGTVFLVSPTGVSAFAKKIESRLAR